MAGFMAGFGNAFANSYERAATRRADKEQDMFRYTFQAALDRRKEREAHDKEEGKLVSTAKDVVKMEGLPEDAVGDIYTYLRAGYSVENAVKKIRAGSYRNTEAPATGADAAGDVGADPTTAAAGAPNQVSSTDEQTVAAMPGATGGLPETVGGVPPTAAEASSAPAPEVTAPVPAPVAPAAPAPVAPEPVPSANAVTAAPEVAQAPVQSEAESMVPDKIRKQVEEAMGSPMDLSPVEDVPSMAPSGKFVPGDPEMDWISDEEAVFKRDEAVAKGDKVGAARYDKIIKAYDERSNKKAMLENPQGTRLVQWTNPDGTVETKAAIQTESGWVRADNQEPVPGTARQIGDDEQKRRDKIAERNPDAVKLQGKQAMATNIFKDGVQIVQMLEDNPDSIGIAGDIAAGLSNLSSEAQSAINILNQDNSENPEAAAEALKTLDDEAKRVDQYLATGIKDAGEAAQLLNAKLILMSYRAGDVEGIRGRDVTEKEYNRMYKVMTGGSSDPKVVQKTLIQYMNALKSNLNTEAKLFNNNNSEWKQYEKDFGPGTAPTAGLVEDMDTIMLNADDPVLKQAHDLMTKKKVDATPDKPENPGLPEYKTPEDAKKAIIDKILRPGDQFWNGEKVMRVPNGQQ